MNLHKTMNNRGKELLFKVLRHEVVDQVPWVPFAGIHAASLKNYTATEILTDGDKLLECLIEVNNLYHPDGQPITFDLQIEAEILGCELRWEKKSPPMVVGYPLANNLQVPTDFPSKSDGRLPIILDAMKKFKTRVGDKTALFGLITGPLTLASHLRGTDIYVDFIVNGDFVKELLAYTTKVNLVMADYYIDAGMDIIATVDPVVSQVSPRVFKEFLLEPFIDVFKHVKEQGRFSSFFVCGNATKNLPLMTETKPDSIFVDENINMVEARKILAPKNIVLGGNIPLTTTMLFGTQQDNMKYVIDLIDKVGKKNLVIAPGCDMPYDVPPENVIGAYQAVQEPELIKQSLRNYEATVINVDVEIPDYSRLSKPLVEVFTIDSSVCAACGYMMVTAKEACEEFSNKVDFVEYKFIEIENIVRAKKLGIKHLPCILINGELKYSSIIPSKEELVEEIKKVQ